MSRTTVYLDVDGVLNAISKRTAKGTGWARWETKPVNGWPILFSPDMVAALNTLAKRPEVTIKWLTTWEADAATILSPAIGIDGQDWEVLTGDQHAYGGESGWWKLEAVQADARPAAGQRFIWIDDDIKSEPDAMLWLAGRDDILMISPTMATGLTPKQFETMWSFAGLS